MSYPCPVCGEEVILPPYHSNRAPHRQCIIDDCTQTIRRGEKVNAIQRNWLSRLGYTPTEFKKEYVDKDYEGKKEDSPSDSGCSRLECEVRYPVSVGYY